MTQLHFLHFLQKQYTKNVNIIELQENCKIILDNHVTV